jgi:hypothetical protein
MRNDKYGEREWLRILFDGRVAKKRVRIDFSMEPESFRRKIGKVENSDFLELTLYSQAFLPVCKSAEGKVKNEAGMIYCYLFRVEDFCIGFDGKRVPTADQEEMYDLCRALAQRMWT